MSAERHTLDFPGLAAEAQTSPSGYVANRRLLAPNQPILQWVLWAADAAAVVGLLYFIVWARNGEVAESYRSLAIITVLLMAVAHHSLAGARRDGNQWSEMWRVMVVWIVTFALILILGFLTKTTQLFSRQVVLVWFATALVGQCLVHIAAHSIFRVYNRHLYTSIPSAVIGSGWIAARLTHCINRNPFSADQIIGVIDDIPDLKNWRDDKVPILSNLENLESVVASGVLDRVYIALPKERGNEVAPLQQRLLKHNIDVIWVPDIFSMNVVNPSIREVSGMPLLSLSESPLTIGTRGYLKSLIDVLGAIAAIVILSPLILIAIAAIRLTSDGPAFYRQTRAGWDGKPFEIWKFRTMYVHEEGSLTLTQAHKNDTRITPVGRFLRRTSMDELPQLLNVLAGNMSLVGPRPHSVIHDREFSGQVNAYLHRYRIKPGMTGLAQVNGLRGEIHSVEDMIRRVELDLDYINRWSLKLDFWILLRTPFALFSRNAY